MSGDSSSFERTYSRDCVVCERSFFYNLKVAQSSLRVTLFVLTLLLSSHQRVTDRRTPTLTSPSDVVCTLQLRCWMLILFSLEAVWSSISYCSRVVMTRSPQTSRDVPPCSD